MIQIIHPSGAHGRFLSFLLNYQAGITTEYDGSVVYDKVMYGSDRLFFAFHSKRNFPGKIINISVDQQSYYKWMAMCFSRANNIDLQFESLEHDTFNKINDHIVLQSLTKSLSVIANKTYGNVEKKYLREWTRLCLFDTSMISQIISRSVIDAPDYKFCFEWFYEQEKLKLSCAEIFDLFNIKIKRDISHLFDKFYEQNNHKDINIMPEKIISAVSNKANIEISQLNFYQEAWIDDWLVKNYKINPVLSNHYFSNTLEIIKQYNLTDSKKIVKTDN